MYKVVKRGTNEQVKPGQQIMSFKGDPYIYAGFESPRHVGSSGRVLVKALNEPDSEERAYYPAVFDLTIVETSNGHFDL
jgi:hypothetical protein